MIASAEALRGTTGLSDSAPALRRIWPSTVSGFLAVTDGPNGISWLEGGTLRHMPAFRSEAIDTLGAGDAFHGAFTLALAEGRDLDAAMRFASATAALKCTHFGVPRVRRPRAEVEAFLDGVTFSSSYGAACAPAAEAASAALDNMRRQAGAAVGNGGSEYLWHSLAVRLRFPQSAANDFA